MILAALQQVQRMNYEAVFSEFANSDLLLFSLHTVANFKAQNLGNFLP